MANTYTQIYIHVVFAVKGRARLIAPPHKEELQKYIAGIIRNAKQKLLAINCMPDHTHLFIAMKPDIALADLVRDIKANSSAFISRKGWVRGKFSWQEGYGAFSYAQSQVRSVITYILNQEQHHAYKTFREEYVDLLREYEIAFENAYLFDEITPHYL